MLLFCTSDYCGWNPDAPEVPCLVYRPNRHRMSFGVHSGRCAMYFRKFVFYLELSEGGYIGVKSRILGELPVIVDVC